MELILWRHAEAEESLPDDQRALTTKGHKQASRMGAWLDRHLPGSCRILVSPAVRTVQTAEALGRKFKIVPELGPSHSMEELLAAANWPDAREPVLVVGHQPTLGQTAAFLIAGTPQDWSVRKGSAWWIVQKERGDNSSNFIKVVMGAEQAGK